MAIGFVHSNAIAVAVVLVLWSGVGTSRSLNGSELLTLLELVADYQLQHPSLRSYTEWAQSTFLIGLSALTSVSQSPRFRGSLVDIIEKNKYKLGSRLMHADDMAIGQVYMEVYFNGSELKSSTKLIKALRDRCDTVLQEFKPGSLEFVGKKKTDQWTWCDSLFMAPPAWLQLYVATGNKDYSKFAVEHWWRTSKYLFDKEEGLYYRDSTYFSKVEKNGRKQFWSRGNGWVLAGLARFLNLLPRNDPERPKFVAHFSKLANRVRSLQSQESGGWSTSLLDPTSCTPSFEVSGTAFYCFAFAWGVNNGVLNSSEFTPAALSAWQSIVSTAIDKQSGRVSHCQPIGSAPDHFSINNSEPYGVGGVLLAGRELLRLR